MNAANHKTGNGHGGLVAVRERASNFASAVRNQTDIVVYDVREAVERFARERPLEAVAICAATGVLLGLGLKALFRRGRG